MSALTPVEAVMLRFIEPAPLLEHTLEWADLNSGSGNLTGLAKVADAMAAAFRQLPGDLALIDPDPVEAVDPDGKSTPVICGQHLLLRVRPEATSRVLLTGHMDTVYATDNVFQACTWRDGQTLQGPGTADMKGGLALLLGALRAFERTEPQLGYDLLINSDEEIGSPSSARLIAELAPGKLAALTYEPALPDGNLARARPGSGNFSAVITGRAAHAGRNPRDGRNAVVAAADLVLRLSAARSDTLAINPARIDGGGPNNIVPAQAIVRFNIRPRTPGDQQAGQALIDAAIAAVAREHDVAIQLHGGFGRPPKPIDARADQLFALVQTAAADLGHAIDWQDSGGVCDGNNVAACGVPVIDTMGAIGGAIHSPDEYLHVPSLAARAGLSALVLHRLDHGAFAR